MATFVIIAFCIALRGEEVPMVVVEGLVDFWHKTRHHRIPHVMITLRGKFKGENNLRWHCIPIGDLSKSRIPSRRWISRLLLRHTQLEGCRHPSETTTPSSETTWRGLLSASLIERGRHPRIQPEEVAEEGSHHTRSQ